MTAPPPAPRPPRVLSRGHRLPAAGLLALLGALLLAPAPAAARPGDGEGRKGKAAGGKGDGRGKGGGEGERRVDPDERALDAAAAALRARDARALDATLPARARVSLRLPGVKEGEYGAAQASCLLARWLEGRPFSSLRRRSLKDGVGTYDAEWPEGSGRARRARRATLILTLADEGGRRVLAGVREGP